MASTYSRLRHRERSVSDTADSGGPDEGGEAPAEADESEGVDESGEAAAATDGEPDAAVAARRWGSTWPGSAAGTTGTEPAGPATLFTAARQSPGMSDGEDSTSDDGFAAERERARELLDREDVDGLYAAVVSDDEYDYVFAHSGGDPEEVGMQAMGLLAQHVGAMVEQTGESPAQVAGDAAMLARTLGVTGEESLADIEAELSDADETLGGDGAAPDEDRS